EGLAAEYLDHLAAFFRITRRYQDLKHRQGGLCPRSGGGQSPPYNTFSLSHLLTFTADGTVRAIAAAGLPNRARRADRSRPGSPAGPGWRPRPLVAPAPGTMVAGPGGRPAR